ncbi:MAG: hypothetical protein O3A51_06105 [Verrucomicrobia bacterium]|nr:hypothetical protein [Verrucomicrobiota bacterium]
MRNVIFPAHLCKLLPLLGSDHEGEVIATKRAIERILTSKKLDWHDLAASLGHIEQGKPAGLADMAARLGSLNCLTSWERKFVPDMVKLLRVGLPLSEKQETALRRTFAKHCGGVR